MVLQRVKFKLQTEVFGHSVAMLKRKEKNGNIVFIGCVGVYSYQKPKSALTPGDRHEDIGSESHILFYCSNVAEQDIQYTVKEHTHTAQHTRGHRKTNKDRWVFFFLSFFLRSFTHSSPNVVMIDTDEFLGGNH